MTAKWGDITAGEIAGAIRGVITSGSPEAAFNNLTTDSREVGKGEIFWALKGEKFDGHDFIEQAIQKGVSGVVIQEGRSVRISSESGLIVISVKNTLWALGELAGWWRHQYSVPIAVITGSVGKTTTKEMTAGILEIGSPTLKNKGNFNNLVGMPLSLLALNPEHRRVVLEMGMNIPGEIGRLTKIADPDVGLITKIAKAHLEGVGDIRGVARAKAEMLEKISPSAHVLLNGDDDVLMEAASAFGRKVVTFGLREKNNIQARNIKNLGREGTAFTLFQKGQRIPVTLRVPGRQNVSNAVAAAAISLYLGERPEHIAEGLSRFKGIKGRFQLITLPGGATLVDDTYNSNPTSLRAAVDSLGDLKARNGGRMIVGLGEMLELGEETVEAHIEAGGMVANLDPAYFIAIGDHAQEMKRGAVDKGFPSARAFIAATHEEMAQKIHGELKQGDIVFLKGSRGAHLEKVIEGLTRDKRS